MELGLRAGHCRCDRRRQGWSGRRMRDHSLGQVGCEGCHCRRLNAAEIHNQILYRLGGAA